MFLDFLLHLRKGGLKVSLNEWLSLIDGLRMGLHEQSLRGFFVLCRTLIIKSETDIDKFEELFYQFFRKVSSDQLRRELEALLHHPELAEEIFAKYAEEAGTDTDHLLRAADSRLYGSETEGFAIDQGFEGPVKIPKNLPSAEGGRPEPGAAAMVQGAGGKSTIHAPGDRKFRDWRTDCAIESRQFQMAFRLLRELSRKLDTQEEELDIRGTVSATCKRGGILDVKMQPPRRNKLKVMVLIDSGGSMMPFEQLCSLLFQSLHKANTFSDLKIYYFHNCLEGQVYLDPSIDTEETLETSWILRNISSDYRVIFVGDGEMAMYELAGGSGTSRGAHVDGLTWFKRFKDKYAHSIWLHPQEREEYDAWMSESFIEIEKVFPMFRLSIDGLKDGMYKLMRGN